jgi:hypothetical protein
LGYHPSIYIKYHPSIYIKYHPSVYIERLRIASVLTEAKYELGVL